MRCEPTQETINPDGTIRWKCKNCGFSDSAISAHFPSKIFRECKKQKRRSQLLPKPGNVAAWLIYRSTGIKLESGGCQCKQRRATMNAKGWLWCVKNLRTICGWMREGWASRAATKPEREPPSKPLPQ
jgi:hypothetical protein